jgi:shikimate kinase
MHKNIILFGCMGTGKTSVGKGLAKQLGMKFVDMDEVIAKREKRSISDIFAKEGEPYFRKLERALVQELSAGHGMVIATGGGVVIQPANVEDFCRTGLGICLTAKPETIVERLEGDGSRPLLAQGDKLQKIRDILSKRKDYYAAVPHQVATDGLNAEQVMDAVLKLYKG